VLRIRETITLHDSEGGVFLPDIDGRVDMDRYRYSAVRIESTDPRNHWDYIQIVKIDTLDGWSVVVYNCLLSCGSLQNFDRVGRERCTTSFVIWKYSFISICCWDVGSRYHVTRLLAQSWGVFKRQYDFRAAGERCCRI